MMDSLHFRRRLLLFVTFFRPVFQVSIKIHEKSVKLWKKVKLDFKEPKTNVQFKSILEIENIKLYEL